MLAGAKKNAAIYNRPDLGKHARSERKQCGVRGNGCVLCEGGCGTDKIVQRKKCGVRHAHMALNSVYEARNGGGGRLKNQTREDGPAPV